MTCRFALGDEARRHLGRLKAPDVLRVRDQGRQGNAATLFELPLPSLDAVQQRIARARGADLEFGEDRDVAIAHLLP